MDKKERVLAAINQKPVDHVPSCFSLHFAENENSGSAGIDAHVRFFKNSGIDILKIMNENLVPCYPEIKGIGDYDKIPSISMKSDFMKNQIDYTKAILDRIDENVFSIGTLHGPVASGIHPLRHIAVAYEDRLALEVAAFREYPEKTLDGMKRITDGLCELARSYIEAGLDGIYFAALGGENRFFTDEEYEKYIKPLDLQVLDAVRSAGGYSILHICKSGINMNRFKDYTDKADVFNWGIYEVPYSLEKGKELFKGKTIMGGLPNRHGVLVDGTDEEIRTAVHDLIRNYGKKGFILGADCTLATEQDMHRLQVAVDATKDI